MAERPSRSPGRTAVVERAKPPVPMVWRFSQREPTGEMKVLATGLASLLLDSSVFESAGTKIGPVLQEFSYDGGGSWTAALDWYWDGERLTALPCRKSRTCTAPSGHKGPCR